MGISFRLSAVESRVAVFTGIEVAALGLWLRSLVRGLRGAAAAFLGGGLVVEHILAYNVRNKRRLLDLAGLPILGILIFSALEFIIWAVGAEGVSRGLEFLPLYLAFFFAFLVKHRIAANVNAGRNLLDFSVFEGKLVTATVFEALFGAYWLVNPSAGTLGLFGVANFVEHKLLNEI